MQYLSEEVVRTNIHKFYQGLTAGDYELMLSSCTKDITLEWTSSTFEVTFRGEYELRQWAENLRRIFPKMQFSEAGLIINGIKAKHQLIIHLSAPDGRRGMLPAVASYNCKDGKIQHIMVTLSKGFLLFTKAQVNSLGIK